VDLVQALRRRGFIDRISRSEIQASSREALVTLVKILLTGPRSWTAPAISKVPLVARFPSSASCAPSRADLPEQITLHPPGIRSFKKNEAKLLPGGEYVLCNSTTLECWSVNDDRLVWSYEKSGAGSNVILFSAVVFDGGEGPNIIVCERSWTTNYYADQRFVFLWLEPKYSSLYEASFRSLSLIFARAHQPAFFSISVRIRTHSVSWMPKYKARLPARVWRNSEMRVVLRRAIAF
jgi:hypothetical protein